MKGRKTRNAIAQKCLYFWILILCASAEAFAQAGRGIISGMVTDSTGAVARGARGDPANHANGVEQHSVTNAGGLYSFISLNPGVYEVTASLKGFESGRSGQCKCDRGSNDDGQHRATRRRRDRYRDRVARCRPDGIEQLHCRPADLRGNHRSRPDVDSQCL